MFEYHCESYRPRVNNTLASAIDTQAVTVWLTTMSSHGWELVTVTEVGGGTLPVEVLYYFRRPKPQG
jgi:hypothetical protein